MEYHFHLSNLFFQAIKNKTKKVEARSMKNSNDRYKKIREGDSIVFQNERDHEEITTTVHFIHHYSSIRDMLMAEGIDNILPDSKTIEQGIEKYNAIDDYQERIKKFGIFAIGIELVKST